jgi:sulfatase modifying factor 1
MLAYMDMHRLVIMRFALLCCLLAVSIFINAAPLGYLQVNVLNADGMVYVNGQYAGTAAPDKALNIMQGYPVGSVTVIVEAKGFKRQSEIYQIKENAWTQAVFTMVRERQETPPSLPPAMGVGMVERPRVDAVRVLLERCRAYLARNALTTPAGANAVECYQQVLGKAPGNTEALKGLSDVEDKYVSWASSNVMRGDLDKARLYLRRLMDINTDNPKVWALQSSIDAKQAGLAAAPVQSAPSASELPPALDEQAVTPAAPSVASFLDIQMANIPAGCFFMGSPPSEAGRDADEQQHKVCVAAFEIGRHEITLEQFAVFVRETNYRTDAENNTDNSLGCYSEGADQGWFYVAGRDWRNPGFSQSSDHPVVCVSWLDAYAFIDWLNAKTGSNYRLPTEAEWEYAARGNNPGAQFWGDSPRLACTYANVADQTSFKKYPAFVPHECDDGYVYTAPIGRFQPNPFGLYDILGNVSEWVCSYYKAVYNDTEQTCARVSNRGLRTNRGGAWMTKPEWVRSAVRARLRPQGRADSVGFRLARDLN